MIIDPMLDIEPEYSASPVPDGVDVYFLGVPNTGKSCLISGLLNQINNSPEATILTNPYAYHLISRHQNGRIVNYTRYDTAIPIGVINDRNRSETLFNIIEIDGQSICEIATSYCADFREIDLQAASLLLNDKPKILFFIIDPTKDEDVCYGFRHEDVYYTARQGEMLDCMIGNLRYNEGIMKNVLAIHLILTKNDVLQLDMFSEILELNGYYNALIYKLKHICRKYNINRKHNYTPLIVPFSVGKFYTTEFYEPESECSKKLLDLILESIRDTRTKRFMNKIRRLIKK